MVFRQYDFCRVKIVHIAKLLNLKGKRLLRLNNKESSSSLNIFKVLKVQQYLKKHIKNRKKKYQKTSAMKSCLKDTHNFILNF